MSIRCMEENQCLRNMRSVRSCFCDLPFFSVKISTALRGEHLAGPSHSFKAADLDSQFAMDVSRHVAMGRRASILLHVSFYLSYREL